jgi:His/Glu/Gln/Arg/opine family amino acid ABC transporter permease subunit
MQSVWTLLSWGPEGWLDEIAYGVFITVTLALATLPLGLLIGFLIAVAKQSQERSLKLAADIYTTIFRGLPELLTLFLVFYGAQIGIQQVVRVFNPMPAKCSCRRSGPFHAGSMKADTPSAFRNSRRCGSSFCRNSYASPCPGSPIFG